MIPPQAPSDIIVEEDVPATMRDGTILRADIYRPRSDEPLPVLLCRTPYEKQCDRLLNDATNMAARNFIVVVQDIRGRYASEGEFLWMFDHGYPKDVDGSPAATFHCLTATTTPAAPFTQMPSW